MYLLCGTYETKCVNSIMLCQQAGNKLWMEPQMLSSVLTDSSHTFGSFDIFVHF